MNFKCYFVITPKFFECLHFEIIKSVYFKPVLETKENQSGYQNFGSKDLYVPSLLVTNNSHGKTKIIAILTIPMGKPMIIVLFTIPMEKTNSRNFLLTKVFWLILVLNMDTYISTYIIYKLTDWIIMIHGNWKDYNYFGFFHGNCKHYNDHELFHGNCKNHNDLGFSMGIVGITIIFLSVLWLTITMGKTKIIVIHTITMWKFFFCFP